MPDPTPDTAPTPSAGALRARLGEVSIAEADRFDRAIGRLRRKPAAKREGALVALASEIDAAARALAVRAAAQPSPTYPDELPITARRDELLDLIGREQVVIVAGETGSGKSTQLPKLCLEAGLGVRGLIGHTQPRRIAARSVAERVAEELGTEIGGAVGYAVRFNDRVGPDARIKVMTDGILLNELQRDRRLLAYDTFIVDEAHERSLNIDFILGYLRQLLPERPDLKVIVTSATIDTQRFSDHFGGAPVVEVSGRTYPVEVRYRPGPGGDPPDDTVAAVADAVTELTREGPGDVLVFASGEREIRDMADAVDGLRLPGTEVLPLFARLSSAEQHRVFAPHGNRRVVIATNIAETSITVPGIRYVVDPGMARISRYNKRTKVQRLPIEDISQASAAQRAGRCGRVAPGICIRLFAEDDHDERPEFTEPEILRTNLASVILQMAAIGLGDVEAFPFVEAPDSRTVADGISLLEDLGALEPDRPAHDRRLTEVGRRMARLPLDPTLARMVIEAEHHDCVHEVMVIASVLSIQDPRERPSGKEQAAAELHARFKVPGSDFLAFVALWDHLKERQRALSSSRFRRECRDEYLHHVRIREWQDVYTQIRQVVRSLKVRINRDPADGDAIHRALLAGLVGNVGNRDDDAKQKGPVEFVGPRGARFAIGRGSALSRKPPRWVVAGELVETNLLWARTVGTIQPAWIEQAAPHLLTTTYTDPTWNRERGSAQVIERVRFRNLTVVEGRTVNLDRVDRDLARSLFIRHALVRGEWDTHHAFVDHNARVVEEVRGMEERARRRDLLVDEEVIDAFFDERLPDSVTDVRRFDRWWRDESTSTPDLLSLSVDVLTEDGIDDVDAEAYPETWQPDDGGAPVEVDIDYRFQPGRVEDGATIEIPLAVLNRTDPAPFDWLVPGLRVELVTALLRALPKTVRRELGPAPDVARAVVGMVGPDDGPLRSVVADEVARRSGLTVDASVWDELTLPDHLQPHFRVIAGGVALAEGPDLGALERRLRPHLRSLLVEHAVGVEVDGLTAWTIGTLPQVVDAEVDGLAIHGYPALIDREDQVGVRILASPSQQRALHWNGTRRLLALQLGRPARDLQRRVDARTLLALTAAPHASVSAATEDAQFAVLDARILDHGGPPFDGEGFAALLAAVKTRYLDDLVTTVETMAEIVTAATALRERIVQPAPASWGPSLDDAADQLAGLVFDGFAVAVGVDRLARIPRYLEALAVRLDRLRQSVDRDNRELVGIRRLMADVDAAVQEHGLTASLDDLRWMIEELRVQRFAQHVGVEGQVSEKRIRERLVRLQRP